jgi:hypothetical protein
MVWQFPVVAIPPQTSRVLLTVENRRIAPDDIREDGAPRQQRPRNIFIAAPGVGNRPGDQHGAIPGKVAMEIQIPVHEQEATALRPATELEGMPAHIGLAAAAVSKPTVA